MIKTFYHFDQNNSFPLGLRCDECESENLIISNGEYICRDCGLVLENKNLLHKVILKKDNMIYGKERYTKLGNRYERLNTPYSQKFERLNWLNKKNNHEETVFRTMKIEISRILHYLELPLSLKQEIFRLTKKIYSCLSKNVKYRNPCKLASVVIYEKCKRSALPVCQKDLLEISKIDRKEFLSFLSAIIKFLPIYDETRKIAYISNKIFEIVSYFEFEFEFFFQVKELLYKLWPIIKLSTEDIIACTLSIISFSVLYEGKLKENLKINTICKKFGVRMSSISNFIKRTILPQFKIEGFRGLIKSTFLLRQLLEKVDFIKKNPSENRKKPNKSDKKSKTEIIFTQIEIYNQNNLEKFTIPLNRNSLNNKKLQGIVFFKVPLKICPLILVVFITIFLREATTEFKVFKNKDPPLSEFIILKRSNNVFNNSEREKEVPPNSE